jgi:hypothetical protein
VGPRTSSEDDGSARAVHPLLATLQSRLPPLIDPYLPFSNRQVLKIFAEEVTLFCSPRMLQLPFDLFDSRADLGE